MSARPKPEPPDLFSQLLAHPSDQPLVHVQRTLPLPSRPPEAAKPATEAPAGGVTEAVVENVLTVE